MGKSWKCWLIVKLVLSLTWKADWASSAALAATKFVKTNTKLYIPVVTRSNQDNLKLLQQSQSGFKITINWEKIIQNQWRKIKTHI